ncbi:replicative DNA helicase [bacterium]|nr:MAG: replicative DNA helicase [bacterium]
MSAIAVVSSSVGAPPQDLDAEQSVLGSILLQPASLLEVVDFLRPEDFYRENHGQIYRAAIALQEAGEPIDNVTLGSELDKRALLERIGGRAQLALLQEQVPTAANIERYARIVKEHAQRRRLVSAGQHIIGLGQDVALSAEEAIDQAGASVFAVGSDRAERSAPISDLLVDAMDRLDSRQESGRGLSGISSGLYDLDALTGGWQGGDLVIVAGRPGMGKTTAVLDFAAQACTAGVPVAIFSLEMSRGELIDRLLCGKARVSSHRYQSGGLNDDELDRIARAAGELGNLRMFIDDRPGLDELALAAEARRLKLREGIGVVVVDYVQLIHGRRRGQDPDRIQEVSGVTRTLRQLARELDVPVLAVSQLSRAPEQRTDKRPMLSDLRETGELEQAADLVVFVYRPEYYKPDDNPGIAEMIVAKHRNGPTGTAEVRFRKELMLFENLARREA